MPGRGAARAGLLGAAALLAAGALTGCRDARLEQMIAVRDEVCQCKDAACVDAALGKLPAKAPREERRAQDVAQQIVRCVGQVAELDPAVVEPEPKDDDAAPSPPPPETPARDVPEPTMGPATRNPPR